VHCQPNSWTMYHTPAERWWAGETFLRQRKKSYSSPCAAGVLPLHSCLSPPIFLPITILLRLFLPHLLVSFSVLCMRKLLFFLTIFLGKNWIQIAFIIPHNFCFARCLHHCLLFLTALTLMMQGLTLPLAPLLIPICASPERSGWVVATWFTIDIPIPQSCHIWVFLWAVLTVTTVGSKWPPVHPLKGRQRDSATSVHWQGLHHYDDKSCVTLPFQDLVLPLIFIQVMCCFLIQMNLIVSVLVFRMWMTSTVCHYTWRVITLVSMTQHVEISLYEEKLLDYYPCNNNHRN
jgi:hypothetical protein